MARYRERLAEEMEDQGMSDRQVAKALTEAGFPIAHTAIFNTRKGTRQPSVDECFWVAQLFGYSTLEEFLIGPPARQAARAFGQVMRAFSGDALMLRSAVSDALTQLKMLTLDPEASAALDAANPQWRSKYLREISQDVDVHARELLTLWADLKMQLEEMLGEGPGRLKQLASLGLLSESELRNLQENSEGRERHG